MPIIGAIVSVILLGAALAAFSAWPVMLLWGAIAGTYDLPTMGFGTALQVSVLVHLLWGGKSSSSD